MLHYVSLTVGALPDIPSQTFLAYFDDAPAQSTVHYFSFHFDGFGSTNFMWGPNILPFPMQEDLLYETHCRVLTHCVYALLAYRPTDRDL